MGSPDWTYFDNTHHQQSTKMAKQDLTFYVRQKADLAFYWELQHDGHTVCTSGEAYPDFGDCLAGLYVFRGLAAKSPLNDRSVDGASERIASTEFEIVCDQDGGFDWTFQQTTGEPLASGIAHPDKDKLLSVICFIKQFISDSEVIVDAEEPVDIESCSARGHHPPRARKYSIRIDKKKYVIDNDSITGRELLQLAKKTPHTRFRLDQKLRDGVIKRIGYDDVVSVCVPGVERFMTIPLDQTDGAAKLTTSPATAELRRHFDLPRGDSDYLNALGLPWETYRESVEDGIRLWLFVHEWQVTKGYNRNKVTVAIMIPSGYPTAQLDMVYFLPALVRADDYAIARTSNTWIEKQKFQRWSRHRTSENPWRPGFDNIATHFSMVECWLEREFEKHPLRT